MYLTIIGEAFKLLLTSFFTSYLIQILMILILNYVVDKLEGDSTGRIQLLKHDPLGSRRCITLLELLGLQEHSVCLLLYIGVTELLLTHEQSLAEYRH